MLTFGYKDKYTVDHLEHYIYEKVVSTSEFETWNLSELLKHFISHPDKAKEHLDEFYHLYCGTYNKQGELTNGYRFLGHLALNYFYWNDEGYLKTIYGDNWKAEYEKSLKDIGLYHQQLKPIAERILQAISEGEIKIISYGEYETVDSLRKELESDTLFELTPPERSAGG